MHEIKCKVVLVFRHHTLKMYLSVQVPCILNLCTIQMLVVSIMLHLLYRGEVIFSVCCIGGQLGSRTSVDIVEMRKISASAGNRTSVICSVCCCFSVVSIFGTLCVSKLYFALFVVISVSKISIKACPSH